jgi:mRNA-degrading endonuclease RelE of RelBE toxin-antitoxin system
MAKGIVWSDQAKADIRAIDREPALQVLKTLARFLKSGEGDTKQLRGYEPPLFRLRAQDYRIFFRDQGDTIEITRVLDRKQAYR